MTQEKPILFSTEMVKAILDGRKTQTRRLMKPQPYKDGNWWKWDSNRPKANLNTGSIASSTPPNEWILTPTYKNLKEGDLLWVRETWATSRVLSRCKPSALHQGFPCEYKAGGTNLSKFNTLIDRGRWRPSIHMPKIAARIWLKVTNIRIERLQEISEADAKAEGVHEVFPVTELKHTEGLGDWKVPRPFHHHQFSFLVLWCKIHNPKSWLENPWVWVVEFEIVSKNGKPN